MSLCTGVQDRSTGATAGCASTQRPRRWWPGGDHSGPKPGARRYRQGWVRSDHRLPARLPAGATDAGLRPHVASPAIGRPRGARARSVTGVQSKGRVDPRAGLYLLHPELARHVTLEVARIRASQVNSNAFRRGCYSKGAPTNSRSPAPRAGNLRSGSCRAERTPWWGRLTATRL